VDSFLKVLFPLIVIGLSFLHLLSEAILRNVRLKRNPKSNANGHSISADQYQRIPANVNSGITADEEEEEGLTIGGGRLALTKTTTQGSIAAIDNPRGQYTLLVVELVTIAA